jgi:protein ImuA
MTLRLHPAIEGLRARIARVERSSRQPAAVLSFGVADIDVLLPGGGLALGALHEVTGAGRGNGDAAAAMLFCAWPSRICSPRVWRRPDCNRIR